MPELIEADDLEELSIRAADFVFSSLTKIPRPLLCAASGGTPTRTYELLVERICQAPELHRKLRIIKLDEWGGIPLHSPASCETHLRRVLISPLQLEDRYIAFESQPENPARECDRIRDWLKSEGPIDVCVLGLGLNGHLGFNEPAEVLQVEPHVAQLSPTSQQHAMLGLAPDRPLFGLTLGMGNLFRAKEIVVLVSGESKRGPIRKMIEGPLTPQFPASLLQLHPSVHVFCDRAAWGRSRYS